MERCGEEGALIDCQRKKNEYYYTTREEVQVTLLNLTNIFRFSSPPLHSLGRF